MLLLSAQILSKLEKCRGMSVRGLVEGQAGEEGTEERWWLLRRARRPQWSGDEGGEGVG